MRYLMSKLENEAKRLNLSLTMVMDTAGADEIFERIKSVIDIPTTTRKRRARRGTQIGWATVARLHRTKDAEAKRQRRDNQIN